MKIDKTGSGGPQITKKHIRKRRNARKERGTLQKMVITEELQKKRGWTTASEKRFPNSGIAKKQINKKSGTTKMSKQQKKKVAKKWQKWRRKEKFDEYLAKQEDEIVDLEIECQRTRNDIAIASNSQLTKCDRNFTKEPSPATKEQLVNAKNNKRVRKELYDKILRQLINFGNNLEGLGDLAKSDLMMKEKTMKETVENLPKEIEELKTIWKKRLGIWKTCGSLNRLESTRCVVLD